MAYRFPSDAWAKALMEELNQNQAYAEVARTWEGDFYFIVEPDDAGEEPVILYVDLWHGKCREAFEVNDASLKTPLFQASAPMATWKKLLTKQIAPAQAMASGLKVKGNMVKLVRNVRAATELFEACTRIETGFLE